MDRGWIPPREALQASAGINAHFSGIWKTLKERGRGKKRRRGKDIIIITLTFLLRPFPLFHNQFARGLHVKGWST